MKSEHGYVLTTDVCIYLDKQNMLYEDSSTIKSDVIYTCVSTHKQAERGDLDRQVEKVKLFAIE